MCRDVRQAASDPISRLRKPIVSQARVEADDDRFRLLIHNLKPFRPELVVQPRRPKHKQSLHIRQRCVQVMNRRMGRCGDSRRVSINAKLPQPLNVDQSVVGMVADWLAERLR